MIRGTKGVFREKRKLQKNKELKPPCSKFFSIPNRWSWSINPGVVFISKNSPLLRYRSASPSVEGDFFLSSGSESLKSEKIHSKMPKKQGAKATLLEKN